MSDTPLTDSLLDHRADLRGPYADPRARWDFDDALAFIAWARLLERDRARLAEALRELIPMANDARKIFGTENPFRRNSENFWDWDSAEAEQAELFDAAVDQARAALASLEE